MKLTLLALFVLPSAALRISPLMSRRQAVSTGASFVPALVALPQIAHADAIEDIAARNNIAADKARAEKAKAKAEGPGFLASAAEGVTGVVVPAVILGLVGGVFFSGSKLISESGYVDDFVEAKKEKRRPLTEAEKRKYKNLSAKEKRDLGIKGL
mmetsp:Transcript_3954/g.7661  ORF Transcript_3954/g.7661 Transcript_3954/m.7661 type:complete len:155 (-) Transcript_3954:209-673(-)